MSYECEKQCGNEVVSEKLADDSEYIKFFDYIQKKFVIYHVECYAQSIKQK